MTEKQRDKVSEIASTIFTAMDNGNVVRDEDGNLVAGLRYGCNNNQTGWSYIYYNCKSHLVSKPIAYCDCLDVEVCKKFFVDKGGKKPEVVK